jgi:hypothetical protein
MLKHCGLEWEDSVLEFHKTKRVVHTFSQQQVASSFHNKILDTS